MAELLDASALAAALLREPGADRVVRSLDRAMILSVNLGEVAATLARGGDPLDAVRQVLAAVRVPVVVPDAELGIEAGLMRRSTDRLGLSLADRLCLAFARRYDLLALTADRAWSEAGELVGARVELIR